MQFSASYIDVLLFIYILSVIIIEIRHLRSEFIVRIVRSPDGKVSEYSLGKMSIQRAAIWILKNYYKDFDAYNPWLENAHKKRGIQLYQLEQSNKKRG